MPPFTPENEWWRAVLAAGAFFATWVCLAVLGTRVLSCLFSWLEGLPPKEYGTGALLLAILLSVFPSGMAARWVSSR